MTDKVISLNGDKDLGEHCEDFVIYRQRKGDSDDFCKTARMPYDKVVTAILIRAAQLLGDEYMDKSGRREIRSDGDWEEWDEGRQLVKKVFPNDAVTCPWGRGVDM